MSSLNIITVFERTRGTTSTKHSGITIFIFFDKMELPRPEIDVKWDSRTHL
jgi:hypothetical protein